MESLRSSCSRNPVEEHKTSSQVTAGGPRPRGGGGYSLLELTIVMTLSALALGFASVAFSGYLHRVSAQRAAQVFARDLVLARSTALRSREPVVVRFYEEPKWYSVALQRSGTELLRRRFGVNADIDLSGVDLSMEGDSVAFDARGVADMGGANGPLGVARFASGTAEYTVSFNAMGASKVEGS